MSEADHVPFPGVEIDYGEDGGVYVNDSHGEVVMWTYDEIREDPGAWTASLHAIGLAARGEFGKIRSLIGKEIPSRTCIAEDCDGFVPCDQGSDYCGSCIKADQGIEDTRPPMGSAACPVCGSVWLDSDHAANCCPEERRSDA